MTLSELRRELIYPLTDGAIIGAIFFFWLLLQLALLVLSLEYAAAMLGVLLVLVMALVVLPAYLKYMVRLVDERANGRKAPAVDADMFGALSNAWALTPIILIAIFVSLPLFYSDELSLAAWHLPAVAVALLLPPSLGVLAITHSALESLNPLALGRMLRRCGIDMLLVSGIVTLLLLVMRFSYKIGLPRFALNLGLSYVLALLFTMTGNVLFKKQLAAEISIDEPLEKGPETVAAELQRSRSMAASHAYGLVSRGNRQGGLQHIREHINAELDRITASAWFFQEMMDWENKEAALFFAQQYLPLLLANDLETEALKLATTCLTENQRWRPLPEDCDPMRAVAQKHGRHDLIAALDSKGSASAR